MADEANSPPKRTLKQSKLFAFFSRPAEKKSRIGTKVPSDEAETSNDAASSSSRPRISADSDEEEASLAGISADSDEEEPGLAGISADSDEEEASLAGISADSDEEEASLAGISADSDEEEEASLTGISADSDEEEASLAGVSADSDEEEPGLAGISAASVGGLEPRAYDISNFIRKKLTEEEKIDLYKHCWSPPKLFAFRKTGKPNPQGFVHKNLERWTWLRYSDFEDGAYCLPCVLFIEQYDFVGNGVHVKPGQFITKPFKRWKKGAGRKGKGKYNKHAATGYHRFCCEKLKGLKSVQIANKPDVLSQARKLDKKSMEQALKNRRNLGKIVEWTLFCGRQDVALRGRVDSGRVTIGENVSQNTGNFRALLIQQMKYDSIDREFKDWIENSAGNSMYTSPRVQNELIALIGDKIKESITKEITEAEFFSVLADEATDVNMDEQMTLCVRYVSFTAEGEAIIKEEFLDFIKVVKLTGRALAETILSSLESNHLNLDFLVGQGYDGASAMSGKHNGVQAVIREKFPVALYGHCASHALNLACVSSCELFKNTCSQVQKIIFWFTYNGQRSTVLKEKINQVHAANQTRRNNLIEFCETRWVERHAAFIRFLELCQPLILALDHIMDSANGFPVNTRNAADGFLAIICRFPFLLEVVIMEKVAGVLKSISKILQEKQVDLMLCCNEISNLKDVLQEYLDDESIFDNLFEKAENLSVGLGVSVSLPRKNVAASRNLAPREYFRKEVFGPFVKSLLEELDRRFGPHNRRVFGLQGLVPGKIGSVSKEELLTAVTFYEKYLPDSLDQFENQFDAYKCHWLKKSNSGIRVPETAIDALQQCDREFYPLVHIMLRIFVTLPVTTASGERSFSAMKRVRTYLRASMGQERFTGLSQMNIHRNVHVSVDEITKEFAKKQNRKANFGY